MLFDIQIYSYLLTMTDPDDMLSWANLCFVTVLITFCFYFLLFSFIFVLSVKCVNHLIEKKKMVYSRTSVAVVVFLQWGKHIEDHHVFLFFFCLSLTKHFSCNYNLRLVAPVNEPDFPQANHIKYFVFGHFLLHLWCRMQWQRLFSKNRNFNTLGNGITPRPTTIHQILMQMWKIVTATGLEPGTTQFLNEHSIIWPNWPNDRAVF